MFPDQRLQSCQLQPVNIERMMEEALGRSRTLERHATQVTDSAWESMKRNGPHYAFSSDANPAEEGEMGRGGPNPDDRGK